MRPALRGEGACWWWMTTRTSCAADHAPEGARLPGDAVGSAEQALVQIAVDTPRVVVSDVRLPGQDGLALFEEIRRTRPTLPVILLTAHGNIRTPSMPPRVASSAT
jgi:two-component system response regulator GlrR